MPVASPPSSPRADAARVEAPADHRAAAAARLRRIESACPPLSLNPALRQAFYSARDAAARDARAAARFAAEPGRPLAAWELRRLPAYALVAHADRNRA